MKRQRPRRRAFTLIDLVAALAFIALAAAVVAPLVGRSRMASQAAVSLGNMKQIGAAHLVYAGDHADAFCNPFDAQNPVNYGDVKWFDIILPNDLERGVGHPRTWNLGNNPSYYTMLFAAHATSLLMNSLESGGLRSSVQFAPQDLALVQRFQRGMADPRLGSNPDDYIWDGSYWMSPTLWLNKSLFAEPYRALVNAPSSNWRRNRIDQTPAPQAKVMIWERFDFSQRSKIRTSGGIEDAYCNWNNPASTPRFGAVDGSAGSVAGSKLVEWAAAPDPGGAAGNALHPSGFWDVPRNFLAFVDLDKDGLENGEVPYNKYSAFFWATRNGVSGRDLNR